ncbi:MHS family MFS transporter [Nocardia farcinica]|uniref:Inner membrane metabolite transport protein yhjE n=1 Tax=Nocardia farcinica TaxID=37329 RepID=A0A0H5NZ67_NOCFR|nr:MULTISPECIES: MFS transporter [Nocardia]AXK84755.1 MFS transporter [Nocardia farcinica]MBF6067384.1 MHS family MFS transporter [Nocardia farcinica]MBF6139901.1 MHS family MFS transporter [Nocardia farcinica]MBF6184188.1 MHS family MFS transporter [Nocardia farcinica]MBF6249472.1 MHS family MFS transporter [Nocardia farcinica]
MSSVLPQATDVDRRRVALATVVGTAVEWYDYFVYAAAAGLVFGTLFFEPAGPGFGTILSFLTVGISFLFRPLGAFLAGHFGDKVGRRPVLVTTLILMGTATALIGLLPTYEAIGIGAPLLLVLLRVLQGVSAGGEWGGAVLMAVEHAPRHRRGLFGAMPQIGVPIGLLLASAMMASMDALFPGEAFLDWGWRIPFLFSVVLIAVGAWVRRRVEESPVFAEIAERKEQTKAPVVDLFARFTPLVLLSALVFAGNSTVGYMTTGGYIQGYATNAEGLALDRGPVLWAVTASSVSWLLATFAAGWISDAIGRRATYIIGWCLQGVFVLTLFPLVNTGEVVLLGAGLVLLTLGLGFTYGAQSAWYTELFPASVRFSGVSISYAIGSIVGGAFAPTIAQWIQQSTGSSANVAYYLLAMTGVGLVGTVLLRDRKGIDLSPSNEAQQQTGIYAWEK